MDNFIKSLVKGAGAIVKKGYQTELKISHKSSAWDLLTEFDLASEKYIIGRIRKRYPDHGILAEERGHMIKRKNFWIIDPIDGTTAFTRGLAQFSVCVAFVSNNVIKLATVYDPIADELFFAQKGKGAFRNKSKIRVAQNSELRHSWIAHQGRSSKGGYSLRTHVDRVVQRQGMVMMRTGSAQLSGAYTACGRYDILVSTGLNPWDNAACALLMQEAGAKVTTIDGKPYRWDSKTSLGANPKLHKKLIAELKNNA
jgi:myo-inositol-1(or 4)-monophosphatase